MYSFPNLEPVCCFMSSSWPAYKFLRRQVRWSGILISIRIFQSVLWSTQAKLFMVNEAEVDVFLKASSFFNDPTDVGILISGSSAFSKSSLYIWKFSVHILLKPTLKDCEHYFANMWNECNCVVVRTFFGIALFGEWDENWPLPVLWPLLCFSNLLAYWVQHLNSVIF